MHSSSRHIWVTCQSIAHVPYAWASANLRVCVCASAAVRLYLCVCTCASVCVCVSASVHLRMRLCHARASLFSVSKLWVTACPCLQVLESAP